jgi:hypothetical protein
MGCTAALGPLQPIYRASFPQAPLVAIKNFSSYSWIGFVRSRTPSKACSKGERRGTANKRSFRSELFLLFRSI